MTRFVPLLALCVGCSPLIYAAMGGAPDETVAIALGEPVHGTTYGAHDDFDPQCSGDLLAPDVAYGLEVPASGRYGIRARATFDIVIAVYEGESMIACNDDHEARDEARLVVDLEAGKRYLVVVDGWGGGEGDFVLAVDARPPAPAPDGPPPVPGDEPPVEDATALASRCASAPPLAEGQTQGVLIPTDADAVTACGGGGRGPEALYRLELASAATLEVEVTTDSVDAIVELRRGCATAEGAEVIACVDDDPDAQHSGLSADLEPGSYLLLVDSYAPDLGGAFTLRTHITRAQEAPGADPAAPEMESTR